MADPAVSSGLIGSVRWIESAGRYLRVEPGVARKSALYGGDDAGRPDGGGSKLVPMETAAAHAGAQPAALTTHSGPAAGTASADATATFGVSSATTADNGTAAHCAASTSATVGKAARAHETPMESMPFQPALASEHAFSPGESSTKSHLAHALDELGRLSAEYSELQEAPEEAAAGDAVALRDAQLQQLRLESILRRYREQGHAPVGELCDRYEGEIESCAADLQRLREEEVGLLAGSFGVAWEERTPSAASSTRSSRSGLTPLRDRHGRCSPRALLTELHSAALETQCCRAASARRWRRARADKWRLTRLQGEMQEVVRAMRSRAQLVADVRKHCTELEDRVRALTEQVASDNSELERERAELARLHQEALALRQSCLVPAQVKRKCATLVSSLEREGGRLNTERRQRGLQTSLRLQELIALQAPTLQPLALSAQAAMEEGFQNYQRMEQQQARMLQRVHSLIARGALEPDAASRRTPRRPSR